MTRRLFLAAAILVLSGGSAMADAITDIGAIKTEVAASSLNASQKSLLTSVLNLAIVRINQGFPNAAILLLQTFNRYVQNFVNSGALDPVTGALWISQSDAVITELGG